MNYRYPLPQKWIQLISKFEEFANGATQVTICTKDGCIYKNILISNSLAIVAMREKDDLPFSIEEISEIYQTGEDMNPKIRGGWIFWDDWVNK